MNRTERIVAFLLGGLVFVGLFVFIFTSLKTPPAAPPMGEAPFFGAEDEEPFDFNVETDTEPEMNVSPAEKATPGTAAPKPGTKLDPQK